MLNRKGVAGEIEFEEEDEGKQIAEIRACRFAPAPQEQRKECDHHPPPQQGDEIGAGECCQKHQNGQPRQNQKTLFSFLTSAFCLLNYYISAQCSQQGNTQHRRLQKAGGHTEEIPARNDAEKDVFQRIVSAESQQQPGQGEKDAQQAQATARVTQSQQSQHQTGDAHVGEPLTIGLGAKSHAQVSDVMWQQGKAQPPGGQAQGSVIPEGHAALPIGQARQFQRGQQLGSRHPSRGQQGQQRHGPMVCQPGKAAALARRRCVRAFISVLVPLACHVAQHPQPEDYGRVVKRLGVPG